MCSISFTKKHSSPLRTREKTLTSFPSTIAPPQTWGRGGRMADYFTMAKDNGVCPRYCPTRCSHTLHPALLCSAFSATKPSRADATVPRAQKGLVAQNYHNSMASSFDGAGGSHSPHRHLHDTLALPCYLQGMSAVPHRHHDRNIFMAFPQPLHSTSTATLTGSYE